jgi:hypothetical protein
MAAHHPIDQIEVGDRPNAETLGLQPGNSTTRPASNPKPNRARGVDLE